MANNYDAIIVGAGMSGLAAGIRLAMFNKKVVILEQHTIAGGLNSYYSRRIKSTKEIIHFDVGLHALTNFAKRGERGKPLTKLLKQLRFAYTDFNLKEQSHSVIKFASAELKFSNDFDLLRSEVAAVFPTEIDNFDKFVKHVLDYNELDLSASYIPSRSVLEKFFYEPLLREMIIAPLLIYGSAWENDMDFSQFVIMFKALYCEGFSRPVGGVRTIISLLEERFISLGGELRYRSSVENILTTPNKKVAGVRLKKGEELFSNKIFSSVGLPETMSLTENDDSPADIGNLSFTESILVTKDKSFLKDNDATIVFYNKSDEYLYQKSASYADLSSAVFCMPDNYDRDDLTGKGHIRVTNMANFSLWDDLEREDYLVEKNKILADAIELSGNLLNHSIEPIFTDIFTPKTVKKYTRHFNGTVYGSTTKLKDGLTEVDGLYIIGTDQGFLGIVGAILSGISMANLHGLMEVR